MKPLANLLRKAAASLEPATPTATPAPEPEPLILERTNMPIGEQSADDPRQEMNRDIVTHWSIALCKRMDESIGVLADMYICEPGHLLALYANVGMYCMGMAETIHNKMDHEPEPEEQAHPVSIRYADPNRGYL
jgi:hypothetical protein